MNTTLINPRIIGFDDYVKDMNQVTDKMIGAAGCEGIDRLLINHINQILEYISIENIQPSDIPDAKMCISSYESNDGKRHHFYFGFKWDEEPISFEVQYLRHQEFNLDEDKKGDIQYYGFDELQKDIERELCQESNSVIKSIEEFLADIMKEIEDEQDGKFTRWVNGESTKDGLPRQLNFEFYKDQYGIFQIFYIGYENG